MSSLSFVNIDWRDAPKTESIIATIRRFLTKCDAEPTVQLRLESSTASGCCFATGRWCPDVGAIRSYRKSNSFQPQCVRLPNKRLIFWCVPVFAETWGKCGVLGAIPEDGHIVARHGSQKGEPKDEVYPIQRSMQLKPLPLRMGSMLTGGFAGGQTRAVGYREAQAHGRGFDAEYPPSSVWSPA